MTHRAHVCLAALSILAGSACASDADPHARAHGDASKPAAAAEPIGCLPSHDGFFRASVRGALNLDIDWHDADLKCEGGPRPDDRGLRVSFAGPLQSDGRRVRFVFGLANVGEGEAARNVPTNVTLIFEGESRLFATRGDDKCTTDTFEQQRVGALGGDVRTWRVTARGFCTEPATTLAQDERVIVTIFDFSGLVRVGEATPATTPAAALPTSNAAR